MKLYFSIVLLLFTSNAFASDLYVAYRDPMNGVTEQCHITPMKVKEIEVDFRCVQLMDYFLDVNRRIRSSFMLKRFRNV